MYSKWLVRLLKKIQKGKKDGPKTKKIDVRDVRRELRGKWKHIIIQQIITFTRIFLIHLIWSPVNGWMPE